MKPFWYTVVLASLVATGKGNAMKPLDNTQEFMYGTFRMPPEPPKEGPMPAQLLALPRDRSPLPEGVWLRFQNFGAARYKDWSAQLQIDDHGNLYLVTHLGDATADNASHPAWPAAPSEQLEAKTLAELQQAARVFAAGGEYHAHEGLSYAPTFVLTVKIDGRDKEIFLNGFEDAFIHRLRWTSYLAFASAKAKGAAPGGKPKAKKPARAPTRTREMP